MADYDKKYRMNSVSKTSDGSTMVAHDIQAIASVTGEDTWFVIPGRHKTINVPAQDLIDALATGTNPQKVTAYKDLLVANLNTLPEPVNGWDLASMETLLDNNDLSAEALEDVEDFLVAIGQTLPVDFNI